MQHRSKLVRYPPVGEGEEGQGVGPHFDAGFVTIVGSISSSCSLPGLNLRDSSCRLQTIEDFKSKTSQDNG